MLVTDRYNFCNLVNAPVAWSDLNIVLNISCWNLVCLWKMLDSLPKRK